MAHGARVSSRAECSMPLASSALYLCTSVVSDGCASIAGVLAGDPGQSRKLWADANARPPSTRGTVSPSCGPAQGSSWAVSVPLESVSCPRSEPATPSAAGSRSEHCLGEVVIHRASPQTRSFPSLPATCTRTSGRVVPDGGVACSAAAGWPLQCSRSADFGVLSRSRELGLAQIMPLKPRSQNGERRCWCSRETESSPLWGR